MLEIEDLLSFDLKQWQEDPSNILLSDGKDNFALFGYEFPRAYQGHYAFLSARGKEAIRLSRLFLSQMFDDYGARLIFGLTPLENKKALWMSRRVGFQSQGIVETLEGESQLFTLLKEEYEEWVA